MEELKLSNLYKISIIMSKGSYNEIRESIYTTTIKPNEKRKYVLESCKVGKQIEF